MIICSVPILVEAISDILKTFWYVVTISLWMFCSWADNSYLLMFQRASFFPNGQLHFQIFLIFWGMELGRSHYYPYIHIFCVSNIFLIIISLFSPTSTTCYWLFPGKASNLCKSSCTYIYRHFCMSEFFWQLNLIVVVHF